jgi:hypothetical protein
VHRAAQTKHPLMRAYGVDALPYAHPKMDTWRETFVGVEHFHAPTNFIFFGAVDDVWVNPAGELLVVDYKATSKDGEVNLDADWQMGYKRQMEIYQWLLRQNGFSVSDTGYFVYANGMKDKKAFDGKLEFSVKVIPYTGNSSWVDSSLQEAHDCLMGELPPLNGACEFCMYRAAAREAEGAA